MHSSLTATWDRQITIPSLKSGSDFNITALSTLKIFICTTCSHTRHVHNTAIPPSQGFQSAHNSSEGTEKQLTCRCKVPIVK